MVTRICRECGVPLTSKTARAAFCSSGHRKTWNNRRMIRGAELYDLWMAHRYDRDQARQLGVWSILCRMAQTWAEEDRAAGRTSHAPPTEALDRLVRYTAHISRV